MGNTCVCGAARRVQVSWLCSCVVVPSVSVTMWDEKSILTYFFNDVATCFVLGSGIRAVTRQCSQVGCDYPTCASSDDFWGGSCPKSFVTAAGLLQPFGSAGWSSGMVLLWAPGSCWSWCQQDVTSWHGAFRWCPSQGSRGEGAGAVAGEVCV